MFKFFNPLCANFTKWSNTLKQFVGKLPTNCLSVFDHFVGLAFKGLMWPPLIVLSAYKFNNLIFITGDSVQIFTWGRSVKKGLLCNLCSMQKQPPEVFFGRTLCLQLYLKKSPTQVFSCGYCKMFKNIYFEEHLQTAALVYEPCQTILPQNIWKQQQFCVANYLLCD